MALAILAWLQTLPEFAVEAGIAWGASRNPAQVHLVTANFTGSLRLLVGLGWPMVYVTAVLWRRKGRPRTRPFSIRMQGEHAVEIICLLPPILYFTFIYLRARLTWIDSLVLGSMYFVYLWVVSRMPPQDVEQVEDLERIPSEILRRPPWLRNGIILSLFVTGGVVLYLCVEPFLESMLRISLILGLSEFTFIQWVAPFLSEFPEKISAFNWARRPSTAPMALMNLVSSNINQWTILVAMIPIVYSVGSGRASEVIFDLRQEQEILLTLAQALLGFLLICDMEFSAYEAAGLFFLWLIQLTRPELRNTVTWTYGAWIGIECLRILARRERPRSFRLAGILLKRHLLNTPD